MNVKNNSRYKMSSEKIETAFLALILNNKYEEISISQICKEAGINRSTFYCHYDDINDLIVKIEQKFAKSMASIFEYGGRLTNRAFVEMFTFIKDNKYFYKAFLNIPYVTHTEHDLRIGILKNIKNSLNAQTMDEKMAIFYRASFFGAGIKEICRLWLERDCEETPEQMASLLLEEYKYRNS